MYLQLRSTYSHMNGHIAQPHAGCRQIYYTFHNVVSLFYSARLYSFLPLLSLVLLSWRFYDLPSVRSVMSGPESLALRMSLTEFRSPTRVDASDDDVIAFNKSSSRGLLVVHDIAQENQIYFFGRSPTACAHLV